MQSENRDIIEKFTIHRTKGQFQWGLDSHEIYFTTIGEDLKPNMAWRRVQSYRDDLTYAKDPEENVCPHFEYECIMREEESKEFTL